MEPLERALERGTVIYGEVLGYGLGCDAFHMTAAHPDGAGMIRAMEKACCNSGILPQDIDYISAHGTGTPANDRLETFAIKQLFGEATYRIPVSSIKSMIGHTMGAASAIEAIACCLSLQHQRIPPTINYDEADPECDLDYVPNEARETDVRFALNSAAAFGGNNAALVLSRLS
jgi:3-oxoacyl-[acyl-carrier-protein] synthase II